MVADSINLRAGFGLTGLHLLAHVLVSWVLGRPISNSKMTGANYIAIASTEAEAVARTRTSFLSSVFKELRGSRKEVIPPVLPERAS